MNRWISKKTKISILFVITVLLLTVLIVPSELAQAHIENLLSNPGFESGDTNWEKWGTPVIDTSEKHSGNQSLQVKKNTGGASKSVAVQAGKTYRIGLWVKFAGAGVSKHIISMEYFGTNNGKESLTFSGSTDWEYRQILFTPATGTQYLRLSFWNNTSMSYFIDDVVIQEYVDTEPPTQPGDLSTEHIKDGLKLTWTGSADESGVTAYQLSYKAIEEDNWQTVIVPHVKAQSKYTYTLENLETYQVYTFKLTAVDEDRNISDAVLAMEATPSMNLVKNPGLETGSVVPWEVWKTLETTTINPYSGQYSLRIKNLTGGGTNKIDVTPNTAYLVSFWARFSDVPVSSFGLKFSLFGSTETSVTMTTPVSTEWIKTEQQIRSKDKDKLMRLSMWNTTGVDMFMDDVFIGAMPDFPINLSPSIPADVFIIGADWVSIDLQ